MVPDKLVKSAIFTPGDLPPHPRLPFIAPKPVGIQPGWKVQDPTPAMSLISLQHGADGSNILRFQ